jgi:quercetin dioxygenase-like cupin family protein
MIKYQVDFSSLDWESPIEGVREKAISDGNTTLRLVEYSQAMPPHWCEKGHFGYILKGRFEMEFQSGTHVFEQGDGVFIPDGPAHRHRARALSDAVKVIFVEKDKKGRSSDST